MQTKRIKLNLLFKHLFLNSKFSLTLGYLNPALNPGGGALGYFLGGYVAPGTPNWHPVLKKNSAKIDTPFQKWANFFILRSRVQQEYNSLLQ